MYVIMIPHTMLSYAQIIKCALVAWHLVRCTEAQDLEQSPIAENFILNRTTARYSDECGKPGGPCNPGADSQFGSAISKDNLCPDYQPCQEGYFCIADALNVGMPEYSSNYCVPQPKNCGQYLKNCCGPDFTCNEKGPEGIPLTCQASGGPYFPPGGGLCMPNPKCGGTGQPCCQPWGHRDFWADKETADGAFSNSYLCDKDNYCNYHTPIRETPINGTCVANDPRCGLLGKPCCIETTTTHEARDNSKQSLRCRDDLYCNLGSFVCDERELNGSIAEVNRLCGKPYGACFPAYDPRNPNSTVASAEDFPDIQCNEQCPDDYFCAVVSGQDDVPACLGPVDPDCGKPGKPCCPWTVDETESKKIDGDLHCDERDSEGNRLQCRSVFSLNRSLDTGTFFITSDMDEGRFKAAIQNSICTKLVECGSENKPCCHDYQDNYVYTNPKSLNAAGNQSLLCGEGLFCHYENFTLFNPQGTCLQNDPECGTMDGSKCCVRSLTAPMSGIRGDINIGEEVFFCRNGSLTCSFETRDSVVQFGAPLLCSLLSGGNRA